MLNQPISIMLKNLENWLRDGTCTPAKCVEGGTLICFTEKSAAGIVYHQIPFEGLPRGAEAMIKNKVKGDTIGTWKILAIYHVWPEVVAKKAPEKKAAA